MTEQIQRLSYGASSAETPRAVGAPRATGEGESRNLRKSRNEAQHLNLITEGDELIRSKSREPIVTLNCKKRNGLVVGTWNVRTLYQTGKYELLKQELQRYRYDIIGISETRWTGAGETTDGFMLFAGTDNIHEKGVGIMLSKRAKAALIGYNTIGPRLITARFRAEPLTLTVIHAYAPTSNCDDEELEDFYNQIQGCIDSTPRRDMIVITGDWNAKIGCDNSGWKEEMGKFGYGEMNERGERLLQFARLNNLYIANTRHRHKASRKWTWESPNGRDKNMIDLVLIQQRWASAIHQCRSFPGADISSDHNLVLCNIKCNLRRIKLGQGRRRRYDVSKLEDNTVAVNFKEMVEAGMKASTKSNNLEEALEEFEGVVTSAAETILGFQQKKRQKWITEKTLKLVEKKREAKAGRTISEQKRKEYNRVCKEVKKSIQQDKENWIQGQCHEIQGCIGSQRPKRAFEIIRSLKKKYQPKGGTFLDKEGKVLSNMEDIVQRWAEYCKELYHDDEQQDKKILRELRDITPKNEDRKDDEEPCILLEEVTKAIAKLKKYKSPGWDGINAEMLKCGGEELAKELHRICNIAWESEKIPRNWSRSIMIPLLKKGDKRNCGNYRTISLISHISKVMLNILLERFKHQTEPFISEEQAGFRKDRSTTQQILSLRLIAEKHREMDVPIYNCFIDFSKAFDSVWHEGLWAVMDSYGVSKKLRILIQELYKQAEAAVLINGRLSEWFELSVGNRQGDPISPNQFLIFLERILNILENIQPKGTKIQGKVVNNLKFADDVDLFDRKVKGLQKQLDAVHEESKRYGLHINKEKTKSMAFCKRKEENKCRIKIESENVENVDCFIYLGSMFTWDNDCSKEIRRRIQIASGAFGDLKLIWRDRSVTLKSKLLLLKTCVMSVLLYASESWTIKKQDEKYLNAFEMRCYRRILDIDWQERITNEEVRHLVGISEDIVREIKRRKFQMFGHICRMSDDRLIKWLLNGIVEGQRPQGRPPKRWVDDLEKKSNKSLQELMHLARDRRTWNFFVSGLNGP